jgi:hypothetical protein
MVKDGQTDEDQDFFFHGCTVHSNVIQSFIKPPSVQPICFKILNFTLKYTINVPTCFGLTKPLSGTYSMCFALAKHIL